MQRTAFPFRRIVFFLSLLVITAPAWAGDGPWDRATLKGIPAIKVVVERVTAEAEKDGLTTEDLQARVEFHLRRAGIPVDPQAVCALYVRAEAKKVTPSLYAVHLSVVLLQSVRPVRDPTIYHPGVPTWSIGFVGAVSSEHLPKVRTGVTDLVDKFITAFLDQNPKP